MASLLLVDLTSLAVGPGLDVIDGVTILARDMVGFEHGGKLPCFLYYYNGTGGEGVSTPPG